MIIKTKSSVKQSLLEYCLEENISIQLSPNDESESDTANSNIGSLLELCINQNFESFSHMKSNVYLPIWLSRILNNDLIDIINNSLFDCQIDERAPKEVSITDPEKELSSISGRIIISASCKLIPVCDTSIRLPKQLLLRKSSPSKNNDDSSSDSSISASIAKRGRKSSGKLPATLSLLHLDNSPIRSKIISGLFNESKPELGERNYLVHISITDTDMSIQTYNIASSVANQLFGKFVELLSWNNLRIKFLKKYPLGPSINIGNLILPREFKPNSSSFSGIFNELRDSKRAQNQKDINNTIVSHEQIYSYSSNTTLKAFHDFLTKYVWSIRLQIESFAKILASNPVAISQSNENLSRTPRSQIALISETKDESEERYVPFATCLSSILRSVNIDDVHKYPLLFSEKRNELFDQYQLNSSQAGSEKKFKIMLVQWGSHFAAYLYFLKFEKVELNDLDSSLTETFYEVNNSLKIKTAIHYFAREINGGVVLIQMAVDGMYSSCSIFSLKYNSEQTKNERLEFEIASNILKRNIHFHSLSYDFHLRIFQQAMEGLTPAIFSVNVINLLSAFVKFNTMRAPLARCRIVKQKLNYDALQLDASIRNYIFNNPQKYGFKSLYLNETRLDACYITTTSPLFLQSTALQSPFIHTLIVYSDTCQLTQTTELSCFVLLLDSMNIFPDEGDTKGLLGDPVQDEYIHSGYYLTDIVKNGIKQVDLMIEMVINESAN